MTAIKIDSEFNVRFSLKPRPLAYRIYVHLYRGDDEVDYEWCWYRGWMPKWYARREVKQVLKKLLRKNQALVNDHSLRKFQALVNELNREFDQNSGQ